MYSFTLWIHCNYFLIVLRLIHVILLIQEEIFQYMVLGASGLRSKHGENKKKEIPVTTKGLPVFNPEMWKT